MLELSSDEMREIIQQLDQAIYNHDQWSKRLIRTLVCQTLPDEHDIANEAHRHCLFGQWYCNHASPKLRKLPGFLAIGAEHERLHDQAAKILRDAASGVAIAATKYDSFENVLDRLRLEIHTLRREFTEMMFNRDPLTGTCSRLGLLTALREYHELAVRGIQICSIALMDLDHFKAINDRYGHLVGDKVLSTTAIYLMNHSRSYDKVFRYGGEEFVVTMPGLSQAQALGLIERLREGIAQNAIGLDGQEIRVTASFGITSLDQGISVENCLDRADKALYAAKAAGRNCSRIWAEEIIVSPPVARATDEVSGFDSK